MLAIDKVGIIARVLTSNLALHRVRAHCRIDRVYMACTAAAALAAAMVAPDCSPGVDSAGDKAAVPGHAEVGIADIADRSSPAAEDSQHRQEAADSTDQPCQSNYLNHARS